MGKSRPSAVRRVVAATATLGVAASLTAAMSSASSAEDGREQQRGAPDVAVREAPTDRGSFVVSGARREAAGPSPAALRDLRAYSRASGEGYDALVASHRGVDEFAAYVDRLERRRPGLYTTAGIGTDGGPNWIQVTRRPGAAEVARIEQLPVDVEVEYGAPASSVELSRLSEQLIDGVGRRPGVVRSAQAAYDPESRSMVLTYTPTDASPLARVTSTVESAVAGAAPEAAGGLPVPVVTREADVQLSHEVNVTGGRDLKQGGGISCTAGFTVVRKGRRGVLSARHCPNNLTYGKRRGVLGKQAAQTSKRKFDLQFHRTRRENGHVTGSRFRAFRQGTRVVRGATNAPRGSVVCHWGAVSGFSCARVRFTNQCVILSGQKTCALDATNRYISAPGDSGGPWFLGNTARGIHAGGGPGSQGQRGISLFTRIGKTSALGARVLRR